MLGPMNASNLNVDLGRKWHENFASCAPVGYLCRQMLPKRWMRVHSLPESKRYPSSAAEYAELLHRHNEVATHVLGEGESCLVFVARFAETPQPVGACEAPELVHTNLVWQPDLSTVVDPDDEQAQTWMHIAAAPIVWTRSAFDTAIRSRADEICGPILFANLARHTAYAPYDGGADLFLPSETDVALAKERWSAWLSARLDGL